jgi:hypothetical protein
MYGKVARWCGRLAGATLAVVAVYALSVGPVFGFCRWRETGGPLLAEIYQPLFALAPGSVTSRYLGLFGVSEVEAFFMCGVPQDNHARSNPQADAEHGSSGIALATPFPKCESPRR